MSELPAGWASGVIGELAPAVRGLTYKKEQAETQAGHGLAPLLRATNIQNGGLLLEEDLIFVPERLIRDEQWVQPGDLVLASSSGSASVVGKSAPLLHPWHGTFGAFCTLLRPSNFVDARFVAHFVASPGVRARWSGLAAGTNINNLKSAHVAETEVPVPPLNEQRRIVAAIEEQFSRLGAADGSLGRANQRLEAARRAALAAELGRDWPSRRFADVAETQLGKMLSEKSKRGIGGRPYLRNKNVQWHRIEIDDLLSMDFTEREYEKFRLVSGDVLVCEGGEVGRAAVWRGEVPECCFQKALHRVRPGELLEPEFLVHVLRRLADRNAFDKYVTGTTIKHLPQEGLREILLPVPPVEDQRDIVGRLEQRSSLIDSLRSAIETSQRRSAALRRSILERAFRGELIPQDPADEPASVLLERIAAERAAEAPPRRAPRARATMKAS